MLYCKHMVWKIIQHCNRVRSPRIATWWRHKMETFSSLMAYSAGNSPVTAVNSPVTGEFPSQRPVTRSFDIFFDQRRNERLSKQSMRWWFDKPLRSLWHLCNEHWHCHWIGVSLIYQCYLSTPLQWMTSQTFDYLSTFPTYFAEISKITLFCRTLNCRHYQ